MEQLNFVRTFDILNSRTPPPPPLSKGFKQPLRPESRHIWEVILKSTGNYLLSVRTIHYQEGINCCQPIKEKPLSLVL